MNSKTLSALTVSKWPRGLPVASSPAGRPQDYAPCIGPRLQHHASSDLDLANKSWEFPWYVSW